MNPNAVGREILQNYPARLADAAQQAVGSIMHPLPDLPAPEPIDLLIVALSDVDVDLPGLIGALRKDRPNLPCSSMPPSAEFHFKAHTAGVECCDLLFKPVKLREFARTLEHLLTTKPAVPPPPAQRYAFGRYAPSAYPRRRG